MGSCIEVWCPFCSAIVGHAWEGERKLRCACLSLGSPAPPQLSWVRSPPLPQTSDRGHAASPQLGAESSGKLWNDELLSVSPFFQFFLSGTMYQITKQGIQEFLKNHFNIKFKWMFTVFNCVYGGGLGAHDVLLDLGFQAAVRSLAWLPELRFSDLSRWFTAPTHQRNY